MCPAGRERGSGHPLPAAHVCLLRIPGPAQPLAFMSVRRQSGAAGLGAPRAAVLTPFEEGREGDLARRETWPPPPQKTRTPRLGVHLSCEKSVAMVFLTFSFAVPQSGTLFLP